MIYDLQKATMWKRISAWLFDTILLAIVAVLCAWLVSVISGFDGYNAALAERYQSEDVTDEVADSESSICWDEAGNRLTAMRGLLVYFTQYQREQEASELQKAAAKEQLDKFMAQRGLL